MCDPGAMQAPQMAQAGFYSSVIGATTSAVGAVTNAISSRRTAEMNAQIADMQAKDAIARGQSAEFNSRLKTSQLKGAQVASMAAHGVALDSGSPLDVLTSTDVMGEQDALTIRNNAVKEAWGYDVQAANFRAKADSSNPWAAGIGSLLGSAGTVASKWYRYQALKNGTAQVDSNGGTWA